jgi:LytS/YehU family sensor histidine kinase
LLRRVSPALTDLVALAAAVAGLGAGLVALAFVRREGWRGVLIPAVIGLVLNALVLLIWVSNFSAHGAPHR